MDYAPVDSRWHRCLSSRARREATLVYIVVGHGYDDVSGTLVVNMKEYDPKRGIRTVDVTEEELTSEKAGFVPTPDDDVWRGTIGRFMGRARKKRNEVLRRR